MEITTTTTHELKWDFPNAQEFHATITNGMITHLAFQDFGELTESPLISTNEKYLLNVYKALKGLFQHLDKIREVGSIAPIVDEDHIEIKWNELGKIIPYSERTRPDLEEYERNNMRYNHR